MNPRTLRRIERTADALLLALTFVLLFVAIVDPTVAVVATVGAPMVPLMVVSVGAEIARQRAMADRPGT